jgi:hypothetical protein
MGMPAFGEATACRVIMVFESPRLRQFVARLKAEGLAK